jgi:hypothetical protein
MKRQPSRISEVRETAGERKDKRKTEAEEQIRETRAVALVQRTSIQ